MESDLRGSIFAIDKLQLESVVSLSLISDKLAIIVAALQEAEAQDHQLDFEAYQQLELSPFDDSNQYIEAGSHSYKLTTRASGEQIFWFGPGQDLGSNINRQIRDYDQSQRLTDYTDINYSLDCQPQQLDVAHYQWLYHPDQSDLVAGCRWAIGSLLKDPELAADPPPAWEVVSTDWFESPHQRQQDYLSQPQQSFSIRSRSVSFEHGQKTAAHDFRGLATPDGLQPPQLATEFRAGFKAGGNADWVTMRQQSVADKINSLKISCLYNQHDLEQQAEAAVGQLAVQTCDGYFLLQEVS